MVNIEQKMEIVRKAVELGASVDVNLHSAHSRDEAVALMGKLGLEYEQKEGDKWCWLKFKTDGFTNCLEVSAFFEREEEPLPFMDEDFLTDADLEEVMKEDMRSEEYVSSFDLHKGEGL